MHFALILEGSKFRQPHLHSYSWTLLI